MKSEEQEIVDEAMDLALKITELFLREKIDSFEVAAFALAMQVAAVKQANPGEWEEISEAAEKYSKKLSDGLMNLTR